MMVSRGACTSLEGDGASWKGTAFMVSWRGRRERGGMEGGGRREEGESGWMEEGGERRERVDGRRREEREWME